MRRESACGSLMNQREIIRQTLQLMMVQSGKSMREHTFATRYIYAQAHQSTKIVKGSRGTKKQACKHFTVADFFRN